MDSPFGLLAELTYRCPLACAYCSNPVDMVAYGDELTTAEWRRVLDEAHELGVLQLHLSGGEPLLRRDIVELAGAARDLGMYTNLVTSALGLSRRRAEELRAAGLDHVQVSIQADEPAISDRIAGTPSFARKVEACQPREGAGLAAHAQRRAAPAEHRPDRRRPAARRGARGRPDRAGQHAVLRLGVAQPRRAAAQPVAARAGRGGRERRPHAAQGPDGRHLRAARLLQPLPQAVHGRVGAAPAHGGAERRRPALPGRPDAAPPARERARRTPLARIWTESPLFQAFRGTDWMPEPCRSCDRKEIDFGGCRCQAFLLTGDAARTDPVCHLSPDHGIVEAAVRAANDGPRELTLVPRPHRVGQP